MRSVIVSNLMSVDGFMAGPGGEIDWFAGLADREFEEYAVDLLDSIDTMLFGRVTYELMASYWPTATTETDDARIIKAMNNCRKIVFSKTLDRADWKNSSLVKGDIAQEIRKLKIQPGKNMVIYGSGGLISALAPVGLIDEYRVFVAPLLLGEGRPLFRELGRRIPLRLVDSRTFGTGLVVQKYLPTHEKKEEG